MSDKQLSDKQLVQALQKERETKLFLISYYLGYPEIDSAAKTDVLIADSENLRTDLEMEARYVA